MGRLSQYCFVEMSNDVKYFINNTLRLENRTSVLTSFHPVDKKGCILNSLAVYSGGFHPMDENRWKNEAMVKTQSEAYTIRMSADEFCFGH